ncbi:hypothetical protein, partial [Cytobacillus pseudoceanisediminis]|uniref:hypothetical protein n=1 Tax=Cytobacillus pseudoceanisediminis TaxID=3051614 RepID=UPI003CE85021
NGPPVQVRLKQPFQFDPVELDYVLKAFKSPQALYYFYFKIKKTADKHDFHRVCRQSEEGTQKGAFFSSINLEL